MARTLNVILPTGIDSEKELIRLYRKKCYEAFQNEAINRIISDYEWSLEQDILRSDFGEYDHGLYGRTLREWAALCYSKGEAPTLETILRYSSQK